MVFRMKIDMDGVMTKLIACTICALKIQIHYNDMYFLTYMEPVVLNDVFFFLIHSWTCSQV